MKIISATGSGYGAQINSNNQLHTYTESASQQHIVSERDGKAFQVWGEANLASGTVVALHCTNDSSTDVAVGTYIRWQILDPSGGTALPNASNYLQIGYGGTFSSGGAITTPVNMNTASGSVSNISCRDSNPTLSGAATYFDRHYPAAEGDMYNFNKEGTLILAPGKTLEFSYVGDHTSGKVYVRFSFFISDQASA